MRPRAVGIPLRGALLSGAVFSGQAPARGSPRVPVDAGSEFREATVRRCGRPRVHADRYEPTPRGIPDREETLVKGADIPRTFCWTRIGTASGMTVDEIDRARMGGA